MKIKKNKPLRLKTRITLLICFVLALSLAITNQLVSIQVVNLTEDYFQDKASNVSRFMAESLVVKEALGGLRSKSEVQTLTETVRKTSGVEFIVVLDMNGIRLSHPNPEMIGKRFVGGDDSEVYKGKTYNSTAEGTLGLSMRSFTPVYGQDGKQIGAIAVGILLNQIQKTLDNTRLMVLIGVLTGFIFGIPGALILAGRIKRILFGLEPDEIARLFEERNALLHSVREGILGVDLNMKITVVNEEAARIFKAAGIPTDVLGYDIDEVVPNSNLHNVIETGHPEFDQEQDINGIQILTNRIPVKVNDRIVGAVATFRDKTEITRIAEQLTGVRLYADALRSQTHEFMNRLHVILGMIHMGHYERVSEYITEVSSKFQDEVGYVMRRIKDPIIAGYIMAKLSNARERGVFFSLREDSFVPELPEVSFESDVATILGNLIENSMDAVEVTEVKEISVFIGTENETLTLIVKDSGEGISPEDYSAIIQKGYSTRGENRGYGMHHVVQIIDKHSGTISIKSVETGGTVITVRVSLSSEVHHHD